jgi:hypothetical protein
VTEEFGREFIYHFPGLSNSSLEKVDLLFSVRGPRIDSETVLLVADGREIFASELSGRQMQYRINLLDIAPESLQDGELVLKFLAPEGDYFVRQVTLNIEATEL